MGATGGGGGGGGGGDINQEQIKRTNKTCFLLLNVHQNINTANQNTMP